MSAIEARVTILVGAGVGWVEYGRALELKTEVWNFVQVFGNLQVLSVLTASSLILYSSHRTTRSVSSTFISTCLPGVRQPT